MPQSDFPDAATGCLGVLVTALLLVGAGVLATTAVVTVLIDVLLG